MRNSDSCKNLDFLYPRDLEEAKRVQECIRSAFTTEGGPSSDDSFTFGVVDVSADLGSDVAYAACVIYRYPSLELVSEHTWVGRYVFPYIPGYLVFREGPVLYPGLSRLRDKMDLIIFDGQGIIHPRGVGIAVHMGYLLDIPTIGFAKRLLFGRVEGGRVLHPETGQLLGYEVSLGRGKPVYISPGWRMRPDDALKIVLRMRDGYKIPRVIRRAHLLANDARRKGKGEI